VTKDAVTTAVAVVAFWPAAFMVQGDKQTIRKNCGIQFQRQQRAAAR